jgi:hypothetical protein
MKKLNLIFILKLLDIFSNIKFFRHVLSKDYVGKEINFFYIF